MSVILLKAFREFLQLSLDLKLSYLTLINDRECFLLSSTRFVSNIASKLAHVVCDPSDLFEVRKSTEIIFINVLDLDCPW